MSTEKDWEISIDCLLVTEGKFVENFSDPGGATNRGITLGFALSKRNLTLFDIDKDGDIDVDDIKKMTDEDAKKIYRKYFWDDIRLNEINSGKLSYLIFDMVVNHGQGILKLIKRTINSVIGTDVLEINSRMDKETVQTINSCDTDELFNNLIEARKQFYKNLVIRRPSSKIFLKGWLMRCQQNIKNSELFEN